MRAIEFANLAKVAVAIFTSVALSACGGAKAKNGTLFLDSTGTTGGTGGTSTAPTSSNFVLGATFGYGSPSYLHTYNSTTPTDWSSSCQVSAANLQYPPVNAGFIGCFLEASEFDIYLSPITLAYSVPAGACDYVEISPFVAWQYQPNIGASAFTANVNSAGTMSIGSATPGNSNLPANSGVRVVNNQPVCQYDYSQDTPPGPNCCPGTYAETLITTDSTGGVTTTSSKGTWGGKIGNCAAGPGVEFAKTTSIGTDSVYNMPRVLDNVATAGYAGTVAIASPLSLGYNSVAYTANYYPTLSSAPAALNQIAYGSSSTTMNLVAPRPYYQFTCYTHGREAKGRILLEIRKWNLTSELGIHGNWNASGSESGDPQSPSSPVDDYNGWEDNSNKGISYPKDSL